MIDYKNRMVDVSQLSAVDQTLIQNNVILADIGDGIERLGIELENLEGRATKAIDEAAKKKILDVAAFIVNKQVELTNARWQELHQASISYSIRAVVFACSISSLGFLAFGFFLAKKVF